MNRRNWLVSTLAIGGGGALLAAGTARHAAATDADARRPAADPRQVMRQRHLPNVALRTHEDRTVRFYDDLVKGRKVVIHFMYTVCGNICTPATRHLLEARSLLGGFADGVHFLSISLTPLQDDPAALSAYRASFGIERGWTFLTGQPAAVEAVQRGLGLLGDDPTNLDDHSGVARILDESQGRWGHVSTLATPRSIARMIRSELT